jgi:hypothetical protein
MKYPKNAKNKDKDRNKTKLTMSEMLRIFPPSSIIPRIHIEELSEEVDSRF